MVVLPGAVPAGQRAPVGLLLPEAAKRQESATPSRTDRQRPARRGRQPPDPHYYDVRQSALQLTGRDREDLQTGKDRRPEPHCSVLNERYSLVDRRPQ